MKLIKGMIGTLLRLLIFVVNSLTTALLVVLGLLSITIMSIVSILAEGGKFLDRLSKWIGNNWINPS